MDRSEWLALRREGIGASDIAAVCGMSPYAGPLEVYMDKLGLLPARESESMRWGLMQERSLADWYEDDQGCTLIDPGPHRSPSHPWIMATPDRGRLNEPVWVELKTSISREGWGEPGTDLVPMGYHLQADWQMIASDGVIERVDICASIGGHPPVIYHIHPDVALFRRLQAIGSEFWARVVERRPPPPDWTHPDTPGLVNLLHRPREGVTVHLDANTGMDVDMWERLGVEASAFSKHRDEVKARIAVAMGDATEGLLPDGRVVSRKLITVAAHSVKESQQVRLSIRKARS